jgi:hypothetical protein
MGVSRTQKALWGVVGAFLVFGLGAYGGKVGGSERGSFTMNYPAQGTECGGPSPRELTGVVSIGVDGAGVLKRTLLPSELEITSHVITNVGTTARSISFEASGFPDNTEYHSRDTSWNPATRTIERLIPPGDSVDFGMLLSFPKPLPNKPVLVDGSVVIRDARTNERLSELPIRVVRSGVAGVKGECCE